MKVTLSKALVIKNRLVGELKKLNDKIFTSNTKTVTVKDTDTVNIDFIYNMDDLLKEQNVLTTQLVNVKVAISLANKDVDQQRRIFLISELKTQILTMQALRVEEDGRSFVPSFRGEAGSYQISKSQISEKQREAMVVELQSKVDTLQEDMEKFNWNTMVEIPD